MNLELTAEGGVRVSQGKTGALLSKPLKEQPIIAAPAPVVIGPADPFIGIGFYAYASGQNVIICEGHLEVILPGGLGGSRGTLDGGIPQATVTVTPGQTGHIVFTYSQETGDAVETGSAEDFDVDFGDPAGDFAVRWDIGSRTTGTENNTVLQPDQSFGRYGYLFKLEPPEPSATLFQAVICNVTVSQAGFPVVQPVHIGPLLVPLGYIGEMTEMFVGYND